jgi:hypothetical protein
LPSDVILNDDNIESGNSPVTTGEDDGRTVMIESLQDPLLRSMYQSLPPLP